MELLSSSQNWVLLRERGERERERDGNGNRWSYCRLAQKAQEDFGREREREVLGDLGTLYMSSILFDDVW
jgi:hypothetical protein